MEINGINSQQKETPDKGKSPFDFLTKKKNS